MECPALSLTVFLTLSSITNSSRSLVWKRNGCVKVDIIVNLHKSAISRDRHGSRRHQILLACLRPGTISG